MHKRETPSQTSDSSHETHQNETLPDSPAPSFSKLLLKRSDIPWLQRTVGNRQVQSLLVNRTLRLGPSSGRTIQRNGPDAGVGDAALPGGVTQTPEQSAVQVAEEQELTRINGLNMFDMLMCFVNMDAAHRTRLSARLTHFTSQVNAPRIQFAIDTATTLTVPATAPGDLESTGQAATARNFVFFRRVNGMSMTDMLAHMAGLARPALDAHMTGQAAFTGMVNMPRFQFAYQVVTTRKMPAGGFSDAAQVTEAQTFLFNDMLRICRAAPTGVAAIAVMTTNRVAHVYGTAGGGSWFDSDTNTMTLDPGEDTTNAALTFVHEMNHARYFHEHRSANVTTMTRAEYVRAEVAEEAEGTVKSIEAKIELEGTTINVSGASFPLETQYRQAYSAAVTAARTRDAALSAADASRIGREAGKNRVIRGFMNGEVQTSNTHQSYPVYYGAAWDRAHPRRP